jgi:glucose/arabinose dehydrogenase
MFCAACWRTRVAPAAPVLATALGVCSLILQAQAVSSCRRVVVDPAARVVTSEKQTFRIEVVAKGLETPWALAFLPDGRLLVTERPGRLRIIEKGRLLPDAVHGTPAVWLQQDGGLFDVEVHPQYSRNGWIYLSYAEPGPDKTSMTAIVRGRIDANRWTDQQFLFHASADLYTASNIHYGSRFVFDKQGHLFYSIGDRGKMEDAQDLSKPTGKIHRVNDDGTAPEDNPFAGRAGALPSIWTYGHRNPQGFAFDPATGKLWETEHGPKGGDELNLIEPGRNYGWAVITNGIQAGITRTAQDGMEQPVVFWTPTFAPSGMTVYTGTRYPAWVGSLFVCGLASQQLRRIELGGDQVRHQEVVLDQVGRVRDVAVGPDGYLYLALQSPGQRLSDSTPGSVVRLIPLER